MTDQVGRIDWARFNVLPSTF